MAIRKILLPLKLTAAAATFSMAVMARFPSATRRLITADYCGSNGVRLRLWKRELRVLTD